VSYPRFIREQPIEASFGFGTTLCTSFGQTYFISLFVPALVGILPISIGQFGSIYAAGTLLGAVLLPFFAAHYDSTPLAPYTRRVFWGLGAASLLLATTVHPLMLLFAIAGLRLGAPGLTTHISNTTMAKGFAKRRGIALGFSSLGYPTGEAILPPLTAALLLFVDWRLIWVGVAILYLFALPAAATWLINRARFSTFVAPDFESAKPSARRNLGRAFKLMTTDRRFWWLLPVQMLLPMLMTAAFLYQAAIAESKGWSTSFMASLFTVFALSKAITALISGHRIDRVGAIRLVGWVAMPAAAGFIILAWSNHPAAAIAFFALVGLTGGSAGNVLTSIWAEIYGTKQLGAIKGLTSSLAVISSALGPAIAGLLIQLEVGFTPMLTGFGILIALGAICAQNAARISVGN